MEWWIPAARVYLCLHCFPLSRWRRTQKADDRSPALHLHSLLENSLQIFNPQLLIIIIPIIIILLQINLCLDFMIWGFTIHLSHWSRVWEFFQPMPQSLCRAFIKQLYFECLFYTRKAFLSSWILLEW